MEIIGRVERDALYDAGFNVDVAPWSATVTYSLRVIDGTPDIDIARVSPERHAL